MTSPYTQQVLKVIVAQVCQTIGWNSIQSTPLELLSDILHKYLQEITHQTHRYSELYGRTEPNLDDVALAFRDMNVNLNDLDEYVSNVDPVPCALDVPKIPLPKENHLNFLKPGSKEVVTRPVHVHEHLPPMYPEKEIDPNAELTNGLNGDIDGENASPHNDKDDIFSTSELSETARLKSINETEVRTTREITSVIMTTSGFISPAREGKLPDSKAPIIPVEKEPKPVLKEQNISTHPTPTAASNSSTTTPSTNETKPEKTKSEIKIKKKKLSNQKNDSTHRNSSKTPMGPPPPKQMPTTPGNIFPPSNSPMSAVVNQMSGGVGLDINEISPTGSSFGNVGGVVGNSGSGVSKKKQGQKSLQKQKKKSLLNNDLMKIDPDGKVTKKRKKISDKKHKANMLLGIQPLNNTIDGIAGSGVGIHSTNMTIKRSSSPTLFSPTPPPLSNLPLRSISPSSSSSYHMNSPPFDTNSNKLRSFSPTSDNMPISRPITPQVMEPPLIEPSNMHSNQLTSPPSTSIGIGNELYDGKIPAELNKRKSNIFKRISSSKNKDDKQSLLPPPNFNLPETSILPIHDKFGQYGQQLLQPPPTPTYDLTGGSPTFEDNKKSAKSPHKYQQQMMKNFMSMNANDIPKIKDEFGQMNFMPNAAGAGPQLFPPMPPVKEKKPPKVRKPREPKPGKKLKKNAIAAAAMLMQQQHQSMPPAQLQPPPPAQPTKIPKKMSHLPPTLGNIDDSILQQLAASPLIRPGMPNFMPWGLPGIPPAGPGLIPNNLFFSPFNMARPQFGPPGSNLGMPPFNLNNPELLKDFARLNRSGIPSLNDAIPHSVPIDVEKAQCNVAPLVPASLKLDDLPAISTQMPTATSSTPLKKSLTKTAAQSGKIGKTPKIPKEKLLSKKSEKKKAAALAAAAATAAALSAVTPMYTVNRPSTATTSSASLSSSTQQHQQTFEKQKSPTKSAQHLHHHSQQPPPIAQSALPLANEMLHSINNPPQRHLSPPVDLTNVPSPPPPQPSTGNRQISNDYASSNEQAQDYLTNKIVDMNKDNKVSPTTAPTSSGGGSGGGGGGGAGAGAGTGSGDDDDDDDDDDVIGGGGGSGAGKFEKRKDKEHRKEKKEKEKEGKIKKKKDKKDKNKNKEKSEKRKEKDEKKREKVSKEKKKKEKLLKKKEKLRLASASGSSGNVVAGTSVTGVNTLESPISGFGDTSGNEPTEASETSVPKLTLKLGSSPRSNTPDVHSKKISHKSKVNDDNSDFYSTGNIKDSQQHHYHHREPSPELARISALVTRPPKQKSTGTKRKHEDRDTSSSDIVRDGLSFEQSLFLATTGGGGSSSSGGQLQQPQHLNQPQPPAVLPTPTRGRPPKSISTISAAATIADIVSPGGGSGSSITGNLKSPMSSTDILTSTPIIGSGSGGIVGEQSSKKTGSMSDQIISTKSSSSSTSSSKVHSTSSTKIPKERSQKEGTSVATFATNVQDSEGNQVWICPACGRVDDGTPMIGCDGCDAWYHWVCVGIQVPPDANEDWYCRVCIAKKQDGQVSDKKKKRKKKDKKEQTSDLLQKK